MRCALYFAMIDDFFFSKKKKNSGSCSRGGGEHLTFLNLLILVCYCIGREGSCLSCHELLSPKQGLELFRLGTTEFSSVHSLAWNLWAGLDQGGLPHDYTHRFLPTASHPAPAGYLSRFSSAEAGWPGKAALRAYVHIYADYIRTNPLRMRPRQKEVRK